MFKNVKRALFALVLAFALAFAFACGGSDDVKEANKENCKDFCEECPTCNNASAETCKDFCPAAPECPATPECKEASKETCKKFQDFVAPQDVIIDGDIVYVGKTKEVYVDEDSWDPENCDKTLIFVSENPSIATVDVNGVVTGVRPGKVLIHVYAALNPDLDLDPVEFEVKEELADQAIVERELEDILAVLPKYVSETTALPQPWNGAAKVTYKVANKEVTALEVAADLAEDTKVVLEVAVTLNDASADQRVDVWLVKDSKQNTYVVLDAVNALLDNYFAKYVAGEKVAADLDLYANLYGCAIKWTPSNASAIASDGKYTPQNEDKAITLDVLLQYGSGSRNLSYKFVAKGFTAEEKADAIMASTFAKMQGKEFNTSIVLPDFDDKFGAKLSYTSLDTAVYDNTGKLVAAVTEAKDVKFKVKIEYTMSSNMADNFVVEKELTIKAVPANAASTFLEAALATDAYKKYQSVVHTPWGKTAGNVVFEALPGMVWDVEAVKLDARLEDGYQIFSQAEAGAALKLEAQYLRYQLVSIKGTFTKDGASTNVVLFFNIGISETPLNVISAIWRSSAQKDSSLSPEQGLYDLAGNVSYFDKKIGYVTETYGSGYFSGWSVTAERAASLTISKKAKTEYPEWKCAVAEVAAGTDFTGINKLEVTVKGTKDEQILLKVNDQNAGEKWVTATGEEQQVEFAFPEGFTWDSNKFPLVVFCNPNADGTGNSFVLTKCQFTGTDKVIDLLSDAAWRGLDAGVYNITLAKPRTWQTFMMEVMTVYIREDANGVYIDPANVNGGIAGAGGNWGVWYVNTTDKEVNIEVGVYGATDLFYKEGHATASSIGSRLNIAMDGYALGFVADKDGKIIHGSNNSKLQNGMEDRRAVLGGKTYKAGDKISVEMFNAMQLEGKETKFEAVYTATDNFAFEQNNEGKFKKVTADDGAVSYVAIKEGEDVAAAERFAPKFAKGAALTADEYAALTADEKKLVSVEYKAKEAVTYVVPNLFGDSSNGAVVNYLTIPANGYAMSWKYQFYGVGDPATVYPFCQDGLTLDIQHYEVHPLSSMDAEYATNYVVAAEGLLEAEKVDHVAFETNVNAARARYDKLSGDTLADVFPAARLTTLEAKAAELLDADIATLLASEPADGEDKSKFAQGLATIWARLYKTEGEAVVNKLSKEITNALTKKAAFDAKYAEYAAIDLHITYDYNGGYAQGFWKDSDKTAFLQTEFLPALYAFMVEKGAWADATAPTLEQFLDSGYWTENYCKFEETTLTKYLFTPKVTVVDGADVVNEHYHDIIEGSDKFFNSPEGHKYIALLDYCDEATRSNNMGGQDIWGRKGEQYAAMEWLPKQSYYTDAKAKDLTTYGGNPVMVTNSGASLGAYRFAQFVAGAAFHGDYKNWIPNNVWSSVFDREKTQKEFSRQIYHCTDISVKLLDDPYREGWKFLGWKFEDGSDAVITGSMFANVTVYAAWAPALEEAIEAALNTQLEGVFYGVPKDIRYMATTETGTIVDQVNTVGLGDYAIVTGGKLFVIPKFAGIELGVGATADVTLETKESVQVYGTDGTAQFSCGLVNDDTKEAGVRAQNSYGYGALYHNASDQFKVTITDARNTYGRVGLPSPKENFGYDKFLFHYDAEKKVYVGTEVSPAEGTSVTLEPGDFLWCPMTAERFCSGLTNCTGVSGVKGVWDGIEHPEAQIISTKELLPAEADTFYDVVFMFQGSIYNEQVIVDAGADTPKVVKPADPELSGFVFVGWATKADATAEEVVEVAEAASNVTYYAIMTEVTSFDAVTVIANYTGEDKQTFATIKEAVNHTNPNGTITVKSGTYADDFTIDKPLTIVGPNAGYNSFVGQRAFEAEITGVVTVAADNVTINGMRFAGGAADSNSAAIDLDAVKGFTLTNCVMARLYGVTDTTKYGNNRRPMVANLAGKAVEDIVIKDNYFDFTAHASGYLKMPLAIGSDGVNNLTFSGNTIAGAPTTAFYLYKSSGTLEYKGNFGTYSHTDNEATLVTENTLIVDPATETEDATHFKTLAAALAAAKEYDIIDVKAGTYAEGLTVDKALLIKGPNAGKAGDAADRAEEAVITKALLVTGNNVRFDGLKFAEEGVLKLGGNNAYIINCLIQPTTLLACNGNNRKAAIVDVAVEGRGNYISGVSLINSKIIITCESTAYTTNYMSFSYLNNLYMKGNYITNTATSAGGGEGIMVYYMKGMIDILDNTFAWPSDGYVTRIGFYQSDCPMITVMDNLFTGVNGVPSVTLGIQKLTAGSYLKIWHNQFRNFNVSTFYCVGSAAGSTIDSQYNFFDAEKPYKFADAGSATVITNNNCYLCEMHSANVYGGTTGDKADANRFETLEALETAYAALE